MLLKSNAMGSLSIFCYLVLFGLVSSKHFFKLPRDIAAASVSPIKNYGNSPGTGDIAAFNIQIFGQNKMAKPGVQNTLVKILLRYDLVLVQEIRDSSQRAIYELTEKLNQHRPSKSKYGVVVSSRLGRSTSKEQYAFVYRRDMFSVKDHYVYHDSKDVFEREPFIVRFSSKTLAIDDFVCVGIHTKPSDAGREIDHLVDVYDDIVKKWKVHDVIIMGDFNAGCSYLTNWKNVRLATDRRFYWLINDNIDTTSGDSKCAYDRIVVSGNKLLEAIVPTSPGVFIFDEEFGITKDHPLETSDHYPVRVLLRSKAEVKDIEFAKEYLVYDKHNKGLNKYKLYKARRASEGYSVITTYSSHGSIQQFSVNTAATGEAAAVSKLHAMKSAFPSILTETQIQIAQGHVKDLDMLKHLIRGNGYYHTLYDYYKLKGHKTLYKLAMHCKVATIQACWISVRA